MYGDGVMKQVEESLPQPLKGLTLPDKETQDTLVLNETQDISRGVSSARPLFDSALTRAGQAERAGQAHAPTEISSTGQRLDRAGSDRLLRTVVENAPVILFTLNHAGIFTLAEGQGLQVLGLRPGELVGTSFFDFHKNAEHILHKFLQVLDGNTVTSINRFGNLCFETHYMPLLDNDGSVSGVIGVATDITERVQAETALTASERRFRAVIEQATDLVLILDANGIFTYASPSHQRIVGYSPQDLIGRNIFDFIHPADKKQVHITWAGAFEATDDAIDNVVTVECRLRHANGSWVTVEAIGRNCLEDPDIRGFIINARDTSEHVLVQEQLRYQLLHDNLTDLPNRTLLLEILGGFIGKAAKAKQELGLIILDINRFRDINDTFGHVEGDRLLSEVAYRLRQAISDSSTIARLGGDEFAIVLPIDSPGIITETLTALKSMLEEPFTIESHTLQIDASAGISLYPMHGDDPITLLRKADIAMFAAKRTHQPFAYYEGEHDQNTTQRLELISGLRHAVLANEFTLYYQPKAQTRTGVIQCAEALIRWQHPAHGLIFPDRFIPLAEQSGFITALTMWTIERAMRQYKDWQAQGIELEIAVNLSMWDLHNPTFPAKIAALFEKYDVPTYRIRMEVTESAAMSNPDLTISVLKRLASLGINCSLDDFGTGYSSLTYIKQLPIDELKIDRSFIQHIIDTPADEAIVSSTITLAHSLGLQVVAEGVEDANTMRLLDALGCDITQGYFLSRPLPPVDFVLWLQKRERSFAAC